MADVQPLSDEERAELVAYLDGEADQRSAREIEARLNRDPRLQAEAEAMRRAGNCSISCRSPSHRRNFTHRTMTAASVVRPDEAWRLLASRAAVAARSGLGGGAGGDGRYRVRGGTVDLSVHASPSLPPRRSSGWPAI